MAKTSEMMMTNENKRSAFDKLAFFLSRRDYTERELIKRLVKDYSVEEILEAILDARAVNMIKKPEALAEQLYHELSRKNKGYLYILNYWRNKGLPSLSIDRELEMQKARKLVMNKLKIEHKPTFEEKQKIYRLLKNRGFDDQTIRDLVKEPVYEEP